jgi:predicted GH43/DUF377 family glycosyl hydrolase
MEVKKSSIRLYASPRAVIANFLHLPGKSRVQNIVARVKNLDDKEVSQMKNEIISDFGNRHREIEKLLMEHFDNVSSSVDVDTRTFSLDRKLVIGAFFTKEYSIQAAALFNPSIVPHPDQTGLKKGQQRFIMSLRATGEGHISSIVFKTGIVDDDMNIHLDEGSGYHTVLKKNDKASASVNQHQAPAEADSNYDLEPAAIPLDEKVLFPSAAAESMGMEDVRFVKFEDKGQQSYYGTYTAYNGKEIRTRLIETLDFNAFKIRTLNGAGVLDKGMALFPEKVNGKYVMVSRQGGEKINIMFSDDLYSWESFQTLLEPQYVWEFVQLGNCGSPIKTEHGWLLLIHGVGPFRTYVISAILLDLNDPAKIKARLDKPLIAADETEREGYVPNVVYTCGLLRHNDFLLIPYAVSDSATGFVTIRLNELIQEMKTYEL